MIVFILTKEFTKLVVVACVIAIPAAYFFMNNWLQDFAYRTDLQLWVFVSASALALFIAILTVGYQAIKAAWINPANSLKYE